MPSGVQWVGGRSAENMFVATPARIINRERTRYLARMERVLQEAVEDYQQFTATRGTSKSGKAGRIESGDMYDAVSYRVWQDPDGNINGEIGFLKEQFFYYFLQTSEGFTHWVSGEFIEPTNALRDAVIIAMEKLKERAY